MTNIPEKQAKIILELWNSGYSGSDISKETGKTRNAVLGLLHRLKSKGYYVEKKAQKTQESKKTKKIKEIRTNKGWVRSFNAVKIQDSVIPEHGMTIMDLTPNSCRFVIQTDTPEGAIFCGHTLHKHRYCEEHFRMCYYIIRKR